MNHWIALPILIPLVSAILIEIVGCRRIVVRRAMGLVACLGTIAAGATMLGRTHQGEIYSYAMGGWEAPFGVVLVADGLSALLVTLTGVVSLFCLLYAMNRHDTKGKFFHFFLQMQVAGICGAVLTGDLFSLFVCFEIMLLASYNLLVYTGEKKGIKAGVHYVFLNLTGSALFLVAIGTLYGVTGTLNMADMAIRVAELGPQDTALVQAGALLLMVVFMLKAAVLPLHLWLPNVYSSAPAPVAAFFAILTKVGVYAIVRVSTLIFGPEAGVAADVMAPYLLPLAVLTLSLGMIGAVGSRRLKTLMGFLIVASIGTILTAVGLYTPEGIAAGLYYLVHSTMTMAMLFLLADLIGRQRGPEGDRLVVARAPAQTAVLGLLFFIGAIAVVGLPPLSGFLGKVWVLQASLLTPHVVVVWGVVLVTGVLALSTLARAGSLIFWKGQKAAEPDAPNTDVPRRATAFEIFPVVGLLACLVFYTALSGPVAEFCAVTAQNLLAPGGYIEAVMGAGQ